MMIREHDFTGMRGCIHCKAVSTAAVCVEREVADPGPSKLRVRAADDADTITARIAELRDERKAALNATPPDEVS